MIFAPGNQYAKGYGRPPALEPQIAKIEAAATRIERFVEDRCVVAVLAGQEPDLAEIDAERRRVLDHLAVDCRHLRLALARLRQHVPAVADLQVRSRRRRRRHPNGTPILHASQFSQDCALAGAMLDRLIPANEALT